MRPKAPNVKFQCGLSRTVSAEFVYLMQKLGVRHDILHGATGDGKDNINAQSYSVGLSGGAKTKTHTG